MCASVKLELKRIMAQTTKTIEIITFIRKKGEYVRKIIPHTFA